MTEKTREAPVTIIKPTSGWRTLNLKELWAYRELLWVLSLRDIKVRYKQTVLGMIWAIIQPLSSMVIFTLIFGKLAKMPSDGFPYPIFVFAGLLPWTFFSTAISASAESVVGSKALVSKVYFPRLIIPMSSVGSGLMDLAVSSLILLILMIFYGVSWSWNLMVVPLLLISIIFTALGVGTLISALNVMYRDFRYMIPFMIQFWMFASPVIYPPSLVPGKWQFILFLNPMTGLIDGFRSAFLGKPFNITAITVSLIVSVFIFVLGVMYFEKMERRFADVI